MVEEAAEDCVGREDAARAHRLVHTPCHLEHAVPVARVDDQVEDLGVRQTHALRLELADHLQQLVRTK